MNDESPVIYEVPACGVARLTLNRPRARNAQNLDVLHGLDARLQEETGMPIVVARDPLNCVAIGSGQCLEEFDALKQVLITSSAG